MTLVREIMTSGATCVGEDENLVTAAALMRDLDVGALPICGNDDRLKGMITDRDIAVRAVAEGCDPSNVRVGDLARGAPVTAAADEDVTAALARMRHHKVRRLPVIEDHRLVGIVSQADVARHLGAELTGEVVESISQ